MSDLNQKVVEATSAPKMINVEVVYALPQHQKLVALQLVDGSSALQAIEVSRIQEACPEIDLTVNKVGIFGKAIRKVESHALRDGDRVEIYRPLINLKKAGKGG